MSDIGIANNNPLMWNGGYNININKNRTVIFIKYKSAVFLYFFIEQKYIGTIICIPIILPEKNNILYAYVQ